MPIQYHTGPLPDVATAYRHFRIYQTGENSSGSDCLMCAGIELYGVLLGAAAKAKAPEPEEDEDMGFFLFD